MSFTGAQPAGTAEKICGTYLGTTMPGPIPSTTPTTRPAIEETSLLASG
ncbi:MAG: hypothetical protein WKF57_19160 [Nakamurella sp.]